VLQRRLNQHGLIW